jgi:hypothetical protein
MFATLADLLIAQPVDASVVEALWTGSVATLLLLAGSITLAMLPWSDREIAEVDAAFRDGLTVAPARGLARR